MSPFTIPSAGGGGKSSFGLEETYNTRYVVAEVCE